MRRRKIRAAVAMSGGVDSSVAAAILKEEGYDVLGFTMLLFDALPSSGDCGNAGLPGGPDATAAAARAAERFGIPHHVVDLRKDFARRVIEPFRRAYGRGRTPNPCILCNRFIKFGALFRGVRASGADFLATGHYARISRRENPREWRLEKARDATRDQSYFLYTLTQPRLARILFPVGNMTKSAVKAMARSLGLSAAERPESREICFIPGDDYQAYLRNTAPGLFRPGPIVDTSGALRGSHKGIAGYTIGQRRGLGIAAPRPLYVIALEATARTVRVGEEEALYRKTLRAGDVRFISRVKPRRPFRVSARIRYKHAESPALVTPGKDGTAVVEFDKPQRAISPGQAVVFYDGDTVLGGGVILT
ncbi:MAG: tRNA 2-thiouridine(34) synthase MnmA [Acidobacteriota bacterium]|nr:tRNA 2-thiouridine(34) synthase MnmA [Acidobacteriota bacterium]